MFHLSRFTHTRPDLFRSDDFQRQRVSGQMPSLHDRRLQRKRWPNFRAELGQFLLLWPNAVQRFLLDFRIAISADQDDQANLKRPERVSPLVSFGTAI